MFVTSWVQVDFPAITWDLLQGGGGGSINNKLVLVRSLRWLEVDGLKCLVRYGMAVGMETSSSKSPRSRCPSAVRVFDLQPFPDGRVEGHNLFQPCSVRAIPARAGL